MPSLPPLSLEHIESSWGLQFLGTHLIFADVVVSHRATGIHHGFLKVVLPDLRYSIFLHILIGDRQIEFIKHA